MQSAVDQDDVDGSAVALDGLDLEHGGVQLIRVHEPLGQDRLRQLDDEGHQVAHAVASGRAGWHHRNIRARVGVFVEEGRVERLLGKLADHLADAFLEFLLHVVLLNLDQVPHVLVRIRGPFVQPERKAWITKSSWSVDRSIAASPIDFVEGYDERCLSRFE